MNLAKDNQIFQAPVCYAKKNDGGRKNQIGRKESMKCKIRNGEAGNAMQKSEARERLERQNNSDVSASVGYVRHRDRVAKEGLKHRVRIESVSDIMQTHNSGSLLYLKHLLHCYLDMVKCVMLLDMPLFVLFLF